MYVFSVYALKCRWISSMAPKRLSWNKFFVKHKIRCDMLYFLVHEVSEKVSREWSRDEIWYIITVWIIVWNKKILHWMNFNTWAYAVKYIFMCIKLSLWVQSTSQCDYWDMFVFDSQDLTNWIVIRLLLNL